MKHLGTFLICGSSLFFIETAFEMYVLTALKGPQLIGFSLAHILPFVLFLVFLSAFCYFALAIFAITVVVLEKLGKVFVAKEYSNRMLVLFCLQALHTTLFLTYDWWAVVFQRSH